MVDDPTIRELREQISATDRGIVAAVNRRLELVARLKRYKASRGIAFVDPQREQTMLAELQRANAGPLSPERLEELFREILDLTKREVAKEE